MSKNSKETDQENETYEIRITGHLEDRWAEWFEPMTVQADEDGTTSLVGCLPDQTALHGVLLKIRNMNLKIISVHQIDENSKKNKQKEK
jgi:hypothetical protein